MTVRTLNATVAEIEALLKLGHDVQQVARDLAEPPNNVYGVYRDLVARGVIEDGKQPGRPAKALQAVADVPQTPPAPRVAPVAPEPAAPPALDALATAAARSTSKRTQQLGVKLHDVAAQLRQRLAAEREQAERAEQERAEREAARAEVERLEAQLRDARAKLSKRRGGAGSMQPPKRTGAALSPERQAKMLAAQHNTDPCIKGCGFVAKTRSGKAMHDKHCGGAA